MPEPLVGLTMSTLGRPEPNTFETVTDGFLRLQQETGLASIEIWMAVEHNRRPHVFWPEAYTPELKSKMKGFLDHFPYHGVHLPFLFNNYIAPNPVIAKAALAQLELGIDVAGELGNRYAVMHAEWDNRGFVSEDDNFARYRDALGRLAERAKRAGLLLCIETCFFIGHRDRAARMIREVNHPNLRITLDAGKAMRNNDFSNENVHKLIEEIGEHIGSTHLYDYPSKTDTSRVLPGCGYVDVQSLVEHLWNKGYRGVFSMETGGDYEMQKRAILTLQGYVKSAMAAGPVGVA